MNNNGQKRRIPASHNNMNSYVNNLNMSKLNIYLNQTTIVEIDHLDGSEKSHPHPHAHHHHHHHHTAANHYSAYYPEMIVPQTSESVDLAAVVEFDKERQTIEKCLSKLAPPIVSILPIEVFVPY